MVLKEQAMDNPFAQNEEKRKKSQSVKPLDVSQLQNKPQNSKKKSQQVTPNNREQNEIGERSK